MIEYSIRVLEYYRLLDILSKYAASPLGRLDCLSLKPLNKLEAVKAEQMLVSEMKELLLVKGFIPLSGLVDIKPSVQKATKEGTCLEINELLAIYNLINVSHKVNEWLLQHRDLCPSLANIASNIPTCHDLVQEIGKSITEDGGVSDLASLALFSVRSKRVALRGEIDRKLHGILSAPEFSNDNLISIRDGRYVISVRTREKNYVKGIVHGYSISRSTCFLEPLSAIEENNRLVELIEKEKEEERKVLKRLTDLVSNSSYDLIACLNIMGKVDGVFARAEFSKAINGARPILTSNKMIYLLDAFNPILLSLNFESLKNNKQGNSQRVVPVDIKINSDKNTLIISGPNRGGKTVALKTIGLLALMSQAGMHIPASEGSILSVFNNILADIGDEQDISSGLSTFSARLEHLKEITNQVTENSLVILDELGSGTDPDEGTAIAMAILDYLSERGSLTAISTHYQILKKYGFVNKKAQNASVEFDSENKKPTFRLLRGAPGVSHAIEVAIDLGVKKKITNDAANYLGKDKGKLNSMMEDFSRMMEELKSEKEAVEIAKQEYGILKKGFEKKEERLKEQLNEMLINKENEIGRLLTEAKREFGEAITLMRKKGTSGQFEATKKYSETKKNLVDTLIELKKGEPIINCSRVTVGQDVFHRKLKRRGRVIGVDERSSKIQILMGNVKLAVDLSELSPVKADDQFGRSDNEQRPWSLYSMPQARKELNIVGHTVDEAIPLVDTLIDKALVYGYSRVKIIHGMGLGVLKRAVREHLKGNHYVKGLIPGDRDGGSDGYTVVEL